MLDQRTLKSVQLVLKKNITLKSAERVQKNKRGGGGMPFDPSQLKKRVFIVDDDLLLLSTIDRYLKRMGIQAYSFSSPKRAIRMLKNVQKTEDLILVTDVQMDEMDGYSLIREAKMISSSLMVIMMTALRKEVCEERMLQCGVQTCLEKPFPLSQLKKAIVES